MQFYDLFVFLLKVAFVVIVVLSVIIGVVWPLMLSMKRPPQSRSIKSPVRHGYSSRLSYLPGEEEALEMPTTKENQLANNSDIVKMALEDPNKTALLIRNWIQEKK